MIDRLGCRGHARGRVGRRNAPRLLGSATMPSRYRFERSQAYPG